MVEGRWAMKFEDKMMQSIQVGIGIRSAEGLGTKRSSTFHALMICFGLAFFAAQETGAQQLPSNAVSLGGASAGGFGSTGAAFPTGAGAMGVTVNGATGANFGAAGPSGQPTLRSSEAPNEAIRLVSRAFNLEPLKPNDFQQFVLQTTGQRLPLFGFQFFENINASQAQAVGAMQTTNAFAPAEGTAVSPDYPLGAGDQLIVRAWGSIDVDVKVSIDRNGQIVIPKVGAVSLAGVKVSQSEAVIKQALAKNYKGFEVNVTLGQLRAITVYVVGQARRPGSYTLSGMSTLSSGLFASGGPNANGSVRRVQLKRAGQVVTEFDLYGFLSQGTAAGDVRLIDGDVIFIPPAAGYVAMQGAVNSQAVYEIKSSGEKLDQLLAVAGGLPITTDPRKVSLERITPHLPQPRSIQNISLQTQGAQGMQAALQSGDLLTFFPIAPDMGNAVTLRGQVAQASRMPWKQGMRVSDLIPNKEALITPGSVRKQNESLFDANRRARTSKERASDSFDSSLWSQQPKLLEPRSLVLADQVGESIEEVNLDYATIERFTRKDLSYELIAFNLGKVLANPQDPENIQLQAGDVVTVFSADDVRIPQVKRRVIVRLEGEVQRPGIYQVSSNELLSDLLLKAGGLTQNAYLFGAGFYREEVRKQQTENLDKLLRRLESESSASLAQVAQSGGAAADSSVIQAKLASATVSQKQSLDRLRSVRAEGRISLSLPASLKTAVNDLPRIGLQNADKFYVPARPDFVYVFGSVNTESALLFRPGLNVSDYISLAGLSSSADRSSVILVRADGSAMTPQSFWRNEVLSAEVLPGDTIVLPEKQDMESAWSAVFRNTKDITQILYQLGLGAAAIKTLRQ
jgi:protein involved in polysaccharide export with SLBB domain